MLIRYKNFYRCVHMTKIDISINLSCCFTSALRLIEYSDSHVSSSVTLMSIVSGFLSVFDLQSDHLKNAGNRLILFALSRSDFGIGLTIF